MPTLSERTGGEWGRSGSYGSSTYQPGTTEWRQRVAGTGIDRNWDKYQFGQKQRGMGYRQIGTNTWVQDSGPSLNSYIQQFGGRSGGGGYNYFSQNFSPVYGSGTWGEQTGNTSYEDWMKTVKFQSNLTGKTYNSKEEALAAEPMLGAGQSEDTTQNMLNAISDRYSKERGAVSEEMANAMAGRGISGGVGRALGQKRLEDVNYRESQEAFGARTYGANLKQRMMEKLMDMQMGYAQLGQQRRSNNLDSAIRAWQIANQNYQYQNQGAMDKYNQPFNVSTQY